MSLYRAADCRPPKARHTGITVTVKKADIKQILRHIVLDARKSPERRIDPRSVKPIIIIDAPTGIEPEYDDEYPKQENYAEDSPPDPIVPTPKISHNGIQFAFKCDQNLWAATYFSIEKFDMTDDGKLMEAPIIHCEQDCVCQNRCNCGLPEWLTTRIKCDGTFIRATHHGAANDESAYQKNGKNVISINPCGSEECKVCEGAEICQDDIEVYNWDF
jgi:hypothetical protein